MRAATSRPASFQVADDADEWAVVSLSNPAICLQADDFHPHRIALVAADGDGKFALRILPCFHDDGRMRDVVGVCFCELEVEMVAAAIVLNNVAHLRGRHINWEGAENAPLSKPILNRCMHEDRMR